MNLQPTLYPFLVTLMPFWDLFKNKKVSFNDRITARFKLSFSDSFIRTGLSS